jgi:hypothetical protein
LCDILSAEIKCKASSGGDGMTTSVTNVIVFVALVAMCNIASLSIALADIPAPVTPERAKISRALAQVDKIYIYEINNNLLGKDEATSSLEGRVNIAQPYFDLADIIVKKEISKIFAKYMPSASLVFEKPNISNGEEIIIELGYRYNVNDATLRNEKLLLGAFQLELKLYSLKECDLSKVINFIPESFFISESLSGEKYAAKEEEFMPPKVQAKKLTVSFQKAIDNELGQLKSFLSNLPK